ncbi:MAG: DUF4335 domain-containing protein [Snowella sp.]|nr:DUF4335 domain-containing protein [Snowella sp.]
MKLFKEVAIQRFTPPTCTLELQTTRSRFEKEKKPLPENVRFELRFDDPRLPDDQQVSMTGTQSQLDRLCEVVNNYIQTFLEQTFRKGLNCAEAPYYQSSLLPETILFAPSDSLSLHPKGLLNHIFCFGLLDSGSIANPMLELSTSQLFDLATALENYSHELRQQANTQPIAQEKPYWVWTGTALISLVALGLIGMGLREFYGDQQDPNPIAANLPVRSKFNFTEVLPPIPPAPSKQPIPNPSLAPSLAVRDPLPPPNTVQAVASPSRNPNVTLTTPPLRVLPPPPVVPPAPPSVTIASNPIQGNNMMVIPNPPSAQGQTPLPILPPNNSSTVGLTTPTLSPPPALPPLPANQQRLTPQPSPSTLTINPITPPPPSNNNYNLLDAIPQVAEARQYFQEKWQPPEDLTQTLEYRLLIKPDGSLDQSIPLGKAASLYLAKLPMPSPGTPFVSPLKVEGEQTVRLVLSPNGSVKTFLE